MEISPVRQAILLLICTALGGACAFAIDVFSEIWRHLGKGGAAALTFISDLLVCILTSCLLLAFSFYFNKGEVRFFCFAGLFLGVAIYRTLLSSFTKLILRKITSFVVKILRVVLTPIRVIFQVLVKTFKIFKYYIFKGLENIKFLLYNIYCRSVTLRKAQKGFLKGNYVSPKKREDKNEG